MKTERTLPPRVGGAELSEAKGRFVALVTGLKISPGHAQTLMELAVKFAREALNRSFDDVCATWREAVYADPEIGGENSAQAKSDAYLAIEKFGSRDLDEILGSGWGDYPAMVRFCANVGKFVRENNKEVARV